MQVPPALAEAAILGPTSELVRRVEIFESDGVTRWANGDNDKRLIKGSVTIDYSRDERRAFDLELDNSDFALEHTPTAFWYDKILKVFCGVKYVDTTPITSLQVRTNLCTNPSFETNVTSWSGVAGGYTTSTISRDATRASQGTACLKVVWPSATQSCVNYSVATTNGLQYTISMDVFVPAGAPAMQVGVIGGASNSSTLNDQWQRVSYTFTGTGSPVVVGAMVANPTGQTAYIDAVLIEQSTTAKAYFSGATANFANRVYAWTGTADASTSTETTTIYNDSAIPTDWEVQVGEFMIDTISEDNFPYTVKVTGRDYTKKCIVSKFTQATSFASGTAIESVIQTIATNAGISRFVLPVTGKSLGKVYFFERGVTRWDAMKQIADGFGFELFFDAQGYLVMREYLDPITAPLAYSLETGSYGNLVSYNKSLNDSRIYNHIVVTGESSDANITPVTAEATNTEPSSPTRIAKLGDRVYEYVSSFITTTPQAQDVADKFLKIHGLEEFDLNFSSIALPWLEVGEIIEFVDPRPSAGQPTKFLLSSLSLPLDLGPMSGNAKRVSVVG